ncbi:unnamed protein product [Rotaria magnacalcarata]|uniref:TAR DNA-binding protein 43 N-terminal domain-containing protein n=2 Tax=Rotaria magnacalcarata TaxID=392030 RepID=A0A816K9Q3_9BILA|nr:unnamed protein product [Rotaria magnacalcarata]
MISSRNNAPELRRFKSYLLKYLSWFIHLFYLGYFSMTMNIYVAQDIDSNDVLHVAVRTDNSVSRATIKAIFPGATILKYKDPNTNVWTCVDLVNDNFKPPHDGTWHSDIIYVPVFPAPAPSIPIQAASSIPIQAAPSIPIPDASSTPTPSVSICAKTFAFDKINLLMVVAMSLVSMIIGTLQDFIKWHFADKATWLPWVVRGATTGILALVLNMILLYWWCKKR